MHVASLQLPRVTTLGRLLTTNKLKPKQLLTEDQLEGKYIYMYM